MLFGLLVYRNLDVLTDKFRSLPKIPEATKDEIIAKKEMIITSGFDTFGSKTGALGNYRIDRQATQNYRRKLASLITFGSIKSAEANDAIGLERGQKPKPKIELLKDTVWLTNYLSAGQHLTKMRQKSAKSLQKSIASTYYFGEKTTTIDSTIKLDSLLLSQINNTLSVDLFKYLNQSPKRSDTLDEYIRLLESLLKRAMTRSEDLQSKINYLIANFESKQQEIQISEEEFFKNIDMFNAPDAEDRLQEFVGLREEEVEIKAKLGAYQSLKSYYDFFIPNIENLLEAIKANRGPLIAGVKVVEIQNMQLPLIIKQQK